MPSDPQKTTNALGRRVRRFARGSEINTNGTLAEQSCARCHRLHLQCRMTLDNIVCGECCMAATKCQKREDAPRPLAESEDAFSQPFHDLPPFRDLSREEPESLMTSIQGQKQDYFDHDMPPATSKFTQEEWDVFSKSTKKHINKGADIDANGTPARLKCDRCQTLGLQCVFPTIHAHGIVCGCCTTFAFKCINGRRAAEPATACDHPSKEPPRCRSEQGDDEDDPSGGYGRDENGQRNETYQPPRITA